jgi:hypothetical protein
MLFFRRKFKTHKHSNEFQGTTLCTFAPTTHVHEKILKNAFSKKNSENPENKSDTTSENNVGENHSDYYIHNPPSLEIIQSSLAYKKQMREGNSNSPLIFNIRKS